jgi:FHS family Na+ dependent glucose MFS transporter 1
LGDSQSFYFLIRNPKIFNMELSEQRKQFTPSHVMLLSIGYYLAFIALGLSTASLGPTLPALATQTGVRMDQISYLFAAKSLGYLVGALHSGGWYNRRPGNIILTSALLVMGAIFVLIPFITWLWLLILVIAIVGYAEAVLDVGGNTLLVWLHRSRVAPWMNALHFFFGFGALFSPLIIAQAVLRTGGIAWGYWLLACVMLPISVWLFWIDSPPAPSGPQIETSARSNNILVFVIISFFFLNVGAESSFGGWVFSYSRALGLANEVTAASLTAAFWGALTIGRLLSIPISSWLRPQQMLMIDLLGCQASLLLIILWPTSQLMLWIGTIGLGVFIASIFPSTMNLAGRVLPIDGRITGLFFIGTSLGGMFFPWLIGQWFEPFGPATVIWVIFSALLLALTVYLVIMARTGTRILESRK